MPRTLPIMPYAASLLSRELRFTGDVSSSLAMSLEVSPLGQPRKISMMRSREVAHQLSLVIEGFISMIICPAVKSACYECWGWREMLNSSILTA